MQVLISFTLNVKGTPTQKEVEDALENDCPMQLVNTTDWEISTERWEIIA